MWWERVVRPAGIEPAAYSLGGYRSIQLSYERTSVLVGRKSPAVKVFVKWKAARTLGAARFGCSGG